MTNDITNYAASIDPTFGFSGKHGGSIDVVGGSQKAASAASQILASLGQTINIGREAALTTAVAAGASMAALGELSPTAIGVGAMAGVISSISKGRA